MALRVLAITEYSDRGEMACLTGLREAGVDVRVMCPAHSQWHEKYLATDLPVIDFAPRKRIDIAASKRIARYVDEQGIDIVHTFNARAVTASILALRKRPNVRLIAYRGIVGNMSFFDPMSWLRYLNPRIDKIICVAEAIRTFFLTMRPAFLRVPAEKIVTIHKGHDISWYQTEPADLAELGIAPSDFVIACVANNRPRKGIDVLIDAVALLPADMQFKLLLIGNMRSKKIDAQIARSPVSEKIILSGYRNDATALVGAADIGVLPSRRREGLPRGVIEAMAQGVPNVVTDSGGSPELIEPGISGFIARSGDRVSLAQAIETLYRDEALRKRMGLAARDAIESKFNYRTTIEKTKALYESLSG